MQRLVLSRLNVSKYASAVCRAATHWHRKRRQQSSNGPGGNKGYSCKRTSPRQRMHLLRRSNRCVNDLANSRGS